MRIAVDAMGGDIGPAVVVPGAVSGARTYGVGLTLVGRGVEIEHELQTLDTAGLDISVVDTPEFIEMTEHPAQAVRRKPRSSIALALAEVKAGRAAAMVSAGNSGAVMAAALLKLGRVPGVERPALAAVVPTTRGRTLLLDIGAVTDPRPAYLVQFAQMGSAYARLVLGVQEPTIGLLSNGEEPSKGNKLVLEAFPLLDATTGIAFHGNVEGRDVVLGTVDVVVTDGFTGNVALKTAEGVVKLITDLLRAQVTATLPRKLAAAVLRPAFRALRRKLDAGEIGAAPLLGVNGTVLIAHGRADINAIAHAIGTARAAAAQPLTEAIAAAVTPPLRQSALARTAPDRTPNDWVPDSAAPPGA